VLFVAKSLITKEHIDELNDILSKKGSNIKLVMSKIISDVVHIQMKDDIYVDHITLGLKDCFYSMLKTFFKSKGIEKISFNNNRTTFWKYE